MHSQTSMILICVGLFDIKEWVPLSLVDIFYSLHLDVLYTKIVKRKLDSLSQDGLIIKVQTMVYK